MGKRSPNFEKRPRDWYSTPRAGVAPLLPYLPVGSLFIEPCAGDGKLIDHLEERGHRCVFACDIEPKRGDVHAISAFSIRFILGDYFITNPPWTWGSLEPLAFHLSAMKPTWLLLPADLMHNVRSAALMDRCALVVPIGRLKWIEGTAHSGMDNCCWYLFLANHSGGPRFMPRCALTE